jgi:mono/diheme cytochrome c family protein
MPLRRITAALLAALVVACAHSEPAPARAGAEAGYDRSLAGLGAEVYLRRCAACHGRTGLGDGPVVPALVGPVPDLRRIAERRGGAFPDGEIARYIDGRFDVPAHGSREMPVWGERFGEAIPESSVAEEVGRGKIASLLEYLKSIQHSD